MSSNLHPGPGAAYAARAATLGQERTACAARSRRIAVLRGVTFVAAVAALVLAGWPGAPARAAAATATVIGAVAFVALVRRHDLVERRLAELDARIAFSLEGLARLDRRWEAITEPPPAEVSEDHPYARDLGIAGRASVLHLIGGWSSGLGRARLTTWLLAPAATGVVAERQAAVASLAPLAAARETLAVHGRPVARLRTSAFDRFLAWSRDGGWYRRRRWLHPLVVALTATIWLLLAAHAAGLIDRALWLLPIGGGWIVTAVWGRSARETFDRADPGRRTFGALSPLLEAAAGLPDAGALRAPVAALAAGPEAAHRAVARLESLLAASDARHMWLHFVLQSLTLWDFHVVAALERWQTRSGRHAGGWLDALAEVEALAALALLAHEEPAWSWPELDPDAVVLAGTAVTHPLLPSAGAVGNDAQVGPPGSTLVITGSNMSGKSTLLRGLGLNAVLAQAGAPVAARRLVLPPLEIATCMRVEDSLAEGVSYFMAELLRLRRVAEVVESPRDGRRGLYLLDEILQGTNTAERRVAARHVIERLIASGAIGAVTTHDLGLADEASIAARATEVHFEETVTGDDDGMTFDYRLRPGRATSVNALRLMRQVGL